MGSYGHTGAYRTLMRRLQEESQRGTKMDLDALNDGFYKDVNLGVRKWAGDKLHRANEWQRAAIQAQLEKLQHPVTAEDIFPDRRKQ